MQACDLVADIGEIKGVLRVLIAAVAGWDGLGYGVGDGLALCVKFVQAAVFIGPDIAVLLAPLWRLIGLFHAVCHEDQVQIRPVGAVAVLPGFGA